MVLHHNIKTKFMTLNDESYFEDLKAIHQECLPYTTYSDATYLQFCNTNLFKNHGVFCNNTLVGYIIFLDNRGDCDVVSIGIMPKYRRMGLGSMLLADTIKLYKLRNIFAEVAVSNTGALSFYIRNHFVQVGVRPNYTYDFQNHLVDALLMKREVR